jgi:hypothetical protein
MFHSEGIAPCFKTHEWRGRIMIAPTSSWDLLHSEGVIGNNIAQIVCARTTTDGSFGLERWARETRMEESRLMAKIVFETKSMGQAKENVR